MVVPDDQRKPANKDPPTSIRLMYSPRSGLTFVLFFFVRILALLTTFTALRPPFWSWTSYTLANPPCDSSVSSFFRQLIHCQIQVEGIADLAKKSDSNI